QLLNKLLSGFSGETSFSLAHESRLRCAGPEKNGLRFHIFPIFSYIRFMIPRVAYWRDKTGREIDIIIDEVNDLIPVEIKFGKTVHSDFFKNLMYWMKLSETTKGFILYGGDQDQSRSNGIIVTSWRNLAREDPFLNA